MISFFLKNGDDGKPEADVQAISYPISKLPEQCVKFSGMSLNDPKPKKHMHVDGIFRVSFK